MGKKILLLLFLASFLFVHQAEAKLLPQAKKTTIKSAAKNTKTSGIGAFPRLRPDRRALTINFSNLQNASSISYMLTYKTNIQDEGALGALNLTGSSNATQELLFGTCSKNVCRYHTNIKNAKLEVSYTLKSGKKYLKKYKIKV
ncbi:hypothetical protein HYU93_05215 [Candidatus Daviesbacteria bacterium]|nr:hypothetical protein [Candidatus Daviesbacteria bacterium]